jgi:hypothetical protein
MPAALRWRSSGRPSCLVAVFIARKIMPITSWVSEASRALICSTVAVKRPALRKMSVLSAKKQKISRAMK